MKYPCITRNDNEIEMILFNEDAAIILNGIHKGQPHDVYPRFRNRYKNITREYLANTWGVVESKEHAEFIIELAEGCGLESLQDDGGNKNYFHIGEKSFALLINKPTYIGNCKQITIPLPPKADINEAGHNLVFASSECKEWPCVNDDVLIDMSGYDVVYGRNVDGLICKVLSIFKDDDTTVYAVNRDGVNYCFIRDLLKKPKTPGEALRDDISAYLCDKYKFIFKAEAMEILEELLTKYNITPKD